MNSPSSTSIAAAAAHIAALNADPDFVARREAARATFVEKPVEEKPVPAAEIEAAVGKMLGGIKLRPTREVDFATSIAPRLAVAGFPARYRLDGLLTEEAGRRDPRVAEQRRKLALLRADLTGRGAIAVLAGPRGTGKTTACSELVAERLWADHAIALTAQRWTLGGVPCHDFRYIKLTDLIGQLKGLYGDFGTIATEQLTHLRDAYARADLLIVDEWHEVPDDSKLKARIASDLFDKRYSAERDSIIITNQLPDEFERTAPESLLSRIQQHSRIFEFPWQSFREKPAQKS